MRGVLILLGILFAIGSCNEDNHRYQPGEQFYAWTNRIGPYHNPHETYDYFSLPFCRPAIPDVLLSKKGGISEVLEGTLLQNSGITFSFGKNQENTPLCDMMLSTEEAEKLQHAIFNHYWYQLEIDGLPIWAKVGDLDMTDEEVEEMEKKGSHHAIIPDKARVYTHRLFTIGMNGDRVVEVNMTSSNPQVVRAGTPIKMTTSVTFMASSIEYNNRFQRYLEYNFFEYRIHWFSVLNSFLIVVFLAGVVALIMMRTLNMDYNRYSQEYDEESLDLGMKEERGWKRVHGDVFRPCSHLQGYAVLMGGGAQIVFTLVVTLICILLSGKYMGRMFSDDNDSVLTIAIGVYVVGFMVNGFVSGSLYKQAFFPRTSPGWQSVMVKSCFTIPVIVMVAYSILCLLSMSYGALEHFPFRNLFSVSLFLLFIVFPLHTIGTILGRSLKGNPNYPCRVASLPSPIPPAPFYAQPKFVCLVSSLLPFGSIFIEVFFIFASIWWYKYYYVYGFLACMLLILIIIQVCVSIVGTYVLLNAENSHWRWVSFGSGASIGIYLFLYCIYFYLFKTEMNGVVQAVYFFAESLLLVAVMALFCGYISSTASELFVRRIFRNIKVD